MYKKTITFQTYDGRTLTDDFYFHLTQAEMVEMEMGENGRMTTLLADIIKTEDQAKIIGFIKTIIMRSYGVRSADGRYFRKSQDLWQDFAQSEAYSELFIELATNADKAAAFINGIMPPDLVTQASELVDSEAPVEEQVKALENLSKEELLAKFKERTEAKKTKK